MVHIDFNKTDVIDVLRHISDGLGGKLTLGIAKAEMKLDNANGKGSILAFEIAGISCLIYDISFSEEISYKILEEEERHLYFIYVIDGYFYHKLGAADSFTKMEANQNIISEVNSRYDNYIRLPKGVPLRYIAINVDHSPQNERFGAYLTELNKNLSASFSRKTESEFYQYIGNHTFKAMQYVEQLFTINHDSAIGRMQMESTICAILAAQIEEYEHNLNAPPKIQLAPNELKKIQNLTMYIEQNLRQKHTVLSLSKQSGLSQKKLQSAFNAIYQTSIIQFIKTLRLEKSRELLIEEPMNVSEISNSLGFTNSSYFNFLFKRKYGISPKKYARFKKRQEL